MTVRVDPTLVGQLARFPGADGQDLGTELVNRFADTIIRLLPRLRELAAGGEAATLALDSHSLRGSAAMLGAVTIAEMSKRIELCALAGELDHADALIDALESEWQATWPELQAACTAEAEDNGRRLERGEPGTPGRVR